MSKEYTYKEKRMILENMINELKEEIRRNEFLVQNLNGQIVLLDMEMQ